MPSLLQRLGAAKNAFFGGSSRRSPMMKRSYDAANIDRLTLDWSSPLTTGDAEMRTRLRQIRGRARQLSQNDPYTKRYLSCLVNNVYDHHGIALRPKAGELVKEKNGAPLYRMDVGANRIIKAAWEEWCKNPFISGDMTFNEGGRLCLKCTARDGDTMVKFVTDSSVNNFGFALQIFEGDILDDYRNEQMVNAEGKTTGQIRMGVEVDQYMKAIAYWILKEYPGDQMWWNNQGYWSLRHEATDWLHLYKKDRITQVRDVSWLVAVMRDMRMLDGFDEAAIVAARTGAAKMGFFVQKASDGNPYDGSHDNMGNLISDAEPGAMEQLPYGMEFQPFNPEYPSDAYDPFVKARVRRIGAGLNMSYYTLANDLTEVNFSSIRAGILDDREQYKAIQTWWIDRFQDPIFNKWLEISLLNGALKDPFTGNSLPFSKLQKFRQHEFRPRRWEWVDPEKDVSADILAINNRLTSRSKVIAEHTADDYEEIIRETAQEQQFAEEQGVELPAIDATKAQIEGNMDEGQKQDSSKKIDK